MENHDITKKGEELIRKLDSENTKVARITDADPFFVLRSDILSFFRGIMSEVSKKETLKNQIESSFEEDLASGDLSFQDRMALYKLISTQSNISVDSILSIFKPTPGAPSLLADNISRDATQDHFEQMFDELKPEDLQKVDKMMKFIEKLAEEKNTHDV